MGGTIRAAFNLAEYLHRARLRGRGHQRHRDRDVPFFGAFPAGVAVTSLDDRRKGAAGGAQLAAARCCGRSRAC